MPKSTSLREELTSSPAKGGAPTVTAPCRAIAWARVSSPMQEERGLSIPEQLREIRQYAEARNIEIVAEFTEAVSAFQRPAKRIEFERMLARARAERVSIILVHDYSR